VETTSQISFLESHDEKKGMALKTGGVGTGSQAEKGLVTRQNAKSQIKEISAKNGGTGQTGPGRRVKNHSRAIWQAANRGGLGRGRSAEARHVGVLDHARDSREGPF